MNLIIKQLKENHTAIDCKTRSQLFDDNFRLAEAQYISLEQALSLTSYLQKEDDLIVWITVFENLRKFAERLIDTPLANQFKVFGITYNY